jgi:hypothetical protein
MNYRWIKELATKNDKKIPALLAMSRGNDPFFAGCAAQKRDAEWFLAVWKRFSFENGVHLRRIHYRIISDKEPTLCSSGAPYENTVECWNYLANASKAARYLRLVDPTAFVDRRNPDPKIYASSRGVKPTPDVQIMDGELTLPSIEIKLEPVLHLPTPEVSGYGYALADQRYHLALWIEKSTMDDVLEPLCRRFGVDLVTGVGFQSITSVITMLRERVRLHKKPTRIFYISDFDPAGEHMPVATARQIEYWLVEYAPDIEIKLTALALTKGQVIHYGLPRTPIKETDARKRGFEDRHGEGAVELDALEALHPGELARILQDAIRPYFDDELRERLYTTGSEATDLVETAWETLIEEEAEQLGKLSAEAGAIGQKFKKRATKLKKDFDMAMVPLRERMESVQHAIHEKAMEFEVDLPARPEPSKSDSDESGWLFDSSRPYLEQIDCYHKYKGTSE